MDRITLKTKVALVAILSLGLFAVAFAQPTTVPPIRQIMGEVKAKADEASDVSKARDELKAAHQDLQNAKKDKRLDVRKKVLEKLADAMIKHLEHQRSRVAKLSNIDADLKTKLDQAITDDVTKVQKKKSEISAATTDDQLKTLAKDLRTLWREVQANVHQIVGAILVSHENKVIEKAGTRLADLQTKAGGKDGTISAALTDAQTNLTDAKNLVKDAGAKFDAITAANVRDNFKAGVQLLRDANKKVVAAYKDFQTVQKALSGSESTSPSPTPTPPKY